MGMRVDEAGKDDAALGVDDGKIGEARRGAWSDRLNTISVDEDMSLIHHAAPAIHRKQNGIFDRQPIAQ
jgi:hypothetical protein